MKKSKLFITAFFCGAALFAETPVSSKTVPLTPEWRKTENNTFFIKRTAAHGGTASLNTEAAVKPRTFYRIDWDARGNITANGGQASSPYQSYPGNAQAAPAPAHPAQTTNTAPTVSQGNNADFTESADDDDYPF